MSLVQMIRIIAADLGRRLDDVPDADIESAVLRAGQALRRADCTLDDFHFVARQLSGCADQLFERCPR